MKVRNKKTEEYRKLEPGEVVAFEGNMDRLRFIVELGGELIAFNFEGRRTNSGKEFLTTEYYTPVKGCFVLEEE